MGRPYRPGNQVAYDAIDKTMSKLITFFGVVFSYLQSVRIMLHILYNALEKSIWLPVEKRVWLIFKQMFIYIHGSLAFFPLYLDYP